MDITSHYSDRKDSKIERLQCVSEDAKNYIESEINSGNIFSDIHISQRYAKELLLPTMNLFDADIPAESKVFPFKGPYLWGRLFYKNSESVRKVILSMHANKSIEGIDYSDYKTTLHYHASNLESYLGSEVPLRGNQKQWLDNASDYFITLIENSQVNKKWPYEYLAIFWDRGTYEQVMAILWNRGELKKDNARIIPL